MLKLLALSALLVLVLVGARRRPESLPLPPGLRLLFVTGSEFLFVGVLLSPLALGVLDDATLDALSPFTAVGLGFVGLHYGLQLEAKLLRWVPLFYNVAPIAQALGGALAVLLPSYALFVFHFGAGTETLVASLVFAAAAACSTPAPLDLLARDKRFAGSPLLLMLRHLAEMGELPALLLYGFAICYRHQEPVVAAWPHAITLQWLLLSVLLGAAFGLILEILPHVGKEGTGRMVVGGLGATFFFTGFARALMVSPLFVGVLAGILVANLPGSSTRLRRFVSRTETPFWMFLLLVAGASWRIEEIAGLPATLLIALAFALMFVRLFGKAAAGWIIARTTHAPRNPPPGFGFGLVAQGGIAVALVLDYQGATSFLASSSLSAGATSALSASASSSLSTSASSSLAAAVVTMILLSVIVTETCAPWVILRVLRQDAALHPEDARGASS